MKIKFYSLFIICFCVGFLNSQTPILNSNPSITNKVIYLDFDGQVVSGTAWNGGNTVNALPSTASANSKISIWQRMSEDYRPFDVNITTDSMRFNNAPPNKRIRVIFTPTYTWYGNGAGGVAFVGSFTWGGYPGTPCWIFETQLGNSAKNMGEAASHEVGHTLSLKHQSTYNAGCTKTNEYNPGTGSGVTSWAPIMGVGYSKNITLFHDGKSADACSLTQYDLGSVLGVGITGSQYLSYLPDDAGDNFNTGKIINLNSTLYSDSCLINTSVDKDAFRFTICNNRYVSINAKPWALDTTTYSGANMDVKLKLYNSSGTLIAGDSATSKLSALVGANLNAGTYFFTIDGDASAYYSDYGVLGKYYFKVNSTNPPAISNTITLSGNICASQSVGLTYTSNATPTIWQWVVNGIISSTFTTQNPIYTFNTPGIYTISLLANTSNSLSCITTNTINIGSSPNLTINHSNYTICPQSQALLTAGGANTYTWLPGNFSGNSQYVSPSSNSTYTIIGSNGSCSTSITSQVSISPGFTISLSNSSNFICPGQSSTITPSGGTNYTLIPGGLNTIPFVVSPFTTSNYTVVGGFGACTKTQVTNIQVSPVFTIDVSRSDSVVCANQQVMFISSGANSYTTYPGPFIGNPIVVTPTATTIYTVTGADANNCLTDSIFTIIVENCNLVGLSSNNTEKEILIFPNPASANIIIQNLNENIRSYVITDAIGRYVGQGEILSSSQLDINTENWTRGIYFVQFNANNKLKIIKKIIIE